MSAVECVAVCYLNNVTRNKKEGSTANMALLHFMLSVYFIFETHMAL